MIPSGPLTPTLLTSTARSGTYLSRGLCGAVHGGVDGPALGQGGGHGGYGSAMEGIVHSAGKTYKYGGCGAAAVV